MNLKVSNNHNVYTCDFVSDDLNLAYHSILPLDVHGANYATMKLITKQYAVPQMVRENNYVDNTFNILTFCATNWLLSSLSSYFFSQ